MKRQILTRSALLARRWLRLFVTCIESLDESVVQDLQKGLERADILLVNAATEFHAGGELVFVLVLQQGFAATDDGLPHRTQDALVRVLDVLLPVEDLDIAQQRLDIAG